jgi:hypothetical protein
MALRTLGTKAATTLACLTSWSQIISAADLAAIGNAISSDFGFAAVLGGFSAGTQYVLATATTAGSTSLTVVTARAGSPPVTQIHVGDLVLGSAADIVPGTYVVAFSGTTATLSQAAVSTGATKGVAFLREAPGVGIDKGGLLTVPNRGVLKVLPGDIVAIDSSGFPILVSGNSVGYAGSDWTLT